MVVRTLSDLAAIRERVRKEVDLLSGQGKVKVVVGMGTCGIAAGAGEVLAAILDELAKRELHWVTVTQTGCAGLCDKEPIVDIIKAGRPKVTYTNVDAERARRIVAQDVVNGHVVSEWAVAPAH